ncbi:major facilitator superfamily domain-containing protein [Xylariaceae sp. FL1019]|nr:major facilitator superfamily domain-containing protein [Xylariaceae sp. FL1019]
MPSPNSVPDIEEAGGPPSLTVPVHARCQPDHESAEEGPDIEPYTIFNKQHKHLLTLIIGVVSLVSPLTANIYLPLLPLLERTYRVSVQSIYLTLTLYVVIAAVFPALCAPAADTYGRRVVALSTSLIYAVASLGLTVNDATAASYPALLLLRALQAVGASASASITYGVISDVCIPAERGTMVGPTISASNVGIVLGPTIGGLIAWKSAHVEYVFLALTLLSALNLSLVLFFMPETARSVVGNGQQGKRKTVRRGFRTFLTLGPDWKRSREPTAPGMESDKPGVDYATDAPASTTATNLQPHLESSGRKRSSRFKFPNPLACLMIIATKHTAIVLYLSGCNYAVWYSVTAAWPQIYSNDYGWSSVAIGLAYLPSSLGIVAAGLVSGPWMNARYRQTAQEGGLSTEDHDVRTFPIERARIRGQWPIFAITHAGIVGLGWAIQQRAQPAILLAIQAIVGAAQSFLFFAFNTLLIDVHHEAPSTASAAASLVRSGLSGIGVAILQPLSRALGWGWGAESVGVRVLGPQPSALRSTSGAPTSARLLPRFSKPSALSHWRHAGMPCLACLACFSRRIPGRRSYATTESPLAALDQTARLLDCQLRQFCARSDGAGDVTVSEVDEPLNMQSVRSPADAATSSLSVFSKASPFSSLCDDNLDATRRAELSTYVSLVTAIMSRSMHEHESRVWIHEGDETIRSRFSPSNLRTSMRRSSSASSETTSLDSGSSSPVHAINAVLFRQPSIMDMEAERQRSGVELKLLEPRPIVYWGGLEERMGSF